MSYNNNEKKNSIEDILAYIGITHDNVREDAYNHWLRFIQFIRDNSGKNWKREIRPKLRSWIGVDFRYIDDYHKCYLTWQISKLEEGILYFIGLPDGVAIPKNEQKEETFMEYAKRKQEGEDLPHG
jgi:hypothetical protein